MQYLNRIKKSIITLFILSLLSPLSAQMAVDVQLNMKHEVGGFSEFDRNKYIVMHASLSENEWDSNFQRLFFLENYDVYLGRNNGTYPWYYDQTAEDPNNPGFPSVADMTELGQTNKNNYASESGAHALESRSDLMIGGQMPMYPNGTLTNPNPCCSTATPWAYSNYDAVADFMANFLSTHYGTGGTTGEPKPKYVEVLNEPFVKTNEYGTTNANISDMHKKVADRIHELHPDVLVGGYTAAFPQLENNDFQHWENTWKLFMDITGESMDFYSVHIYDYHPTGNTMDSLSRRSGSNAEAILDMIEHYSLLEFGQVKPFNISEYGYFSPGLLGTPYTKERDWGDLRSFSTQMMQFMERPNQMLKAIPFLLLKANWWTHPSGNKYPHRLLRQKNELPGESGTSWVYTELVKFYELWSEVKGTRIETHPSNLDIQVDAYVDGNKAYLILNNLTLTDQAIQLNLFENHDNMVENLEVKHLYEINGLPILAETSPNVDIDEINLGREATMILTYTFADELMVDESYVEEKIYADKYLQTIQSNQPITFQLNDLTTGEFGEAVLRLGLGRNHGKSLQPEIKVNGTEIDVPNNWRGYDQANRDRFFGVLEIPVPHELIDNNTEVVITFPDNGGHISSLAIQNYLSSKAINRTGVTTSIDQFSEKELFDFSVYPNPSEDILHIQSDAALSGKEVIIQDMKGVVWKKLSLGSSVPKIEIKEIPQGIYFISIQHGGQVISKKIEIMR